MAGSKTPARTPSTRRAPARARTTRSTRTSTKTAPTARPEAITAAEAATKAEGPKKQKKLKVVRDSFTMPQSDYDKIAALKKRFLKHGASVKKSELLRAGLHLLERLADPVLLEEIGLLESVKTGRPAKQEVGKEKGKPRKPK